MKAGFFFQSPVNIDLLSEISKRNNLELVGAYINDNGQSLEKNKLVFDSAEELLVQVQVAFIFLNGDPYFDLATKALKRGINIFLADLPSYNHASLLELNQLSFEIGVPIGFGCSGSCIIRHDEIVGNYFMMQLIRDAGSDTDDDSFRRMLIYDVASFVRIKPCGMRKFRVDSLPLFNKNPKAINLRFEYDNSSVIASSITRVDEPKRCVLRFFSGNNGYFKEVLPHNIVFNQDIINTPNILFEDPEYMSNLEIYIQEIQNKSNLNFGIDNALETLSIIESIEGRLYPMN
ncbi:MAG: hypothetical protein AB9846_17125 [Tenuifilaceae bacterium]